MISSYVHKVYRALCTRCCMCSSEAFHVLNGGKRNKDKEEKGPLRLDDKRQKAFLRLKRFILDMLELLTRSSFLPKRMSGFII